jgi:hypothetical protein
MLIASNAIKQLRSPATPNGNNHQRQDQDAHAAHGDLKLVNR